ncbi:hypothetical protein B0H17DRAFT_1208526 [Mycena rosella]|uniref:RRM domain-containing protein n=1 Tax=Mycena rosella TaxID=1033263 RepID=A0AAD7D485_MYCRO|nr:hypothetical protein B0H17DRAFT_1208526 [Mycena rosella]
MSLATRFLGRSWHNTHRCPSRAFTSPPSSPNAQKARENAQLDIALRWANRVLAGPTTVSVHNVPPDAALGEFMRLVMFGPLLRVEDRPGRLARVISLTFVENATAVAFFHEMNQNKVVLRGSRLMFAWAHPQGVPPGPLSFLVVRPPVPPQLVASRALYIHDTRRLGTREQFHQFIARYGPIERATFRGDAAIVNFLAVSSAIKTAEALREDGVKASFTEDRCSVAGRARAAALKSRTRQVILGDIPPGTRAADLCDHIRGGALERILVKPGRRFAFIHFLEHASAAAFYRHAHYHGITLGEQRLSARIQAEAPDVVRLPADLARRVAAGASRCVRVTDVLLPEARLRRELERLGPIERFEHSPSSRSATVAFESIQHAIMAVRAIQHPVRWRGWSDAGFAVDPCAAPLRGTSRTASKTARELQGQMSDFLRLHAWGARAG